MIDLPHFGGGTLKNGDYDSETETRLRFFTVYVPTEFHRMMFNCIMLTNKHTNKDILSKKSTLLCYATVVENKLKFVFFNL